MKINTLIELLQAEAAKHGNIECHIGIWDKEGGEDGISMCADDDLPICDAEVINNMDGPDKILAIDFSGYIASETQV